MVILRKLILLFGVIFFLIWNKHIYCHFEMFFKWYYRHWCLNSIIQTEQHINIIICNNILKLLIINNFVWISIILFHYFNHHIFHYPIWVTALNLLLLFYNSFLLRFINIWVMTSGKQFVWENIFQVHDWNSTWVIFVVKTKHEFLFSLGVRFVTEYFH